MVHQSRQLEQTESAIHAVLESLTESQEALVEIGEKLEDGILKRFFLAESLKRADFRNELEAALNQEGISDLRGNSDGSAHRAWVGINSRFGGGDHALLAIAEQGDDATEEAYLRAMSTVLPVAVRELLSTQATHIHESNVCVKVARGRMSRNAA